MDQPASAPFKLEVDVDLGFALFFFFLLCFFLVVAMRPEVAEGSEIKVSSKSTDHLDRHPLAKGVKGNRSHLRLQTEL
ncbi:hypothetical protein GJAV_G00007380 [Gymnothorax javanicus]|nr:hypothetical protein GJAV_G00007380 [Gymnothorax javanicus]